MRTRLMRTVVPAVRACLPVVAAACIAAPGRLAAQPSTAEQEVLAFIIREHGAGAAVEDSTWAQNCRSAAAGGCERPYRVNSRLWANYLDAIRSRAAVRDLLPPHLPVTFTSELQEGPATACERRRPRIELSRAGLSRDGNSAIVSYALWIPMDHMGCGAVSGRTVLLRRNRAGDWRVARSLILTIS